MQDIASAFGQQLIEMRRSTRTVRTYAGVAESALRFFAVCGLGGTPARGDVQAFLARPTRDGRHRSAPTHNQELAALRSLAAFCVERGHWLTNPTNGLPFVREPARDPAVLSVDELRKLFALAAQRPSAFERARAIAILAVLSQGGLRVHELAALDVSQLDALTGTLVAVRGKGGTVHDVPLNTPTSALLMQWLVARAEVASRDELALFVSVRGTRISVRTVQKLMAALARELGTAKHVTPHTLRHTTATLAISFGADLSTVADLLRHTDLNTTRRYLHLVDERRREAVRRLGAAIPAELISKAEMDRSGAAPGDANGCVTRENRLDAQHGLGVQELAA